MWWSPLLFTPLDYPSHLGYFPHFTPSLHRVYLALSLLYMRPSQNHHKTRLIQCSSSDPDSDYVEKVPTLKKRKRGSTKSTTPRSNNKSEVKTRTSGDTCRHLVSQHTISDPIPLRNALLQWYSGVHENRGMPWRKPYNPNLTMEERSQRAYEVRCIFQSQYVGRLFNTGVDLRNYVTTNTGCHCHWIL